MKNFAYKTVHVRMTDALGEQRQVLDAALNDLSARGWELVTALPIDGRVYILFLKQEAAAPDQISSTTGALSSIG